MNAKRNALLGYAATLLGVLALWMSLHIGASPTLSERSSTVHALVTLGAIASGAALTYTGFRVLTARPESPKS